MICVAMMFQEALPSEKWEGIFEAKDDRKLCMQIKQLNEDRYEFQGSEDCLYLNVHTADIKVSVNVSSSVCNILFRRDFVNFLIIHVCKLEFSPRMVKQSWYLFTEGPS